MTAETKQWQFVVPSMHCAGCMNKVERALGRVQGVTAARVNLSTKRVSVALDDPAPSQDMLVDALAKAGFDAAPFDPRLISSDEKTRERELLTAMAVSGFAAANVMLLSVAVWAGLFSGMEIATRQFFHWVSAAIALPAVAYAGRPFFRSAWGAARRGQINMDVPISLAVVLAAAASLFETLRGGGAHVYFDASVSLLFFLLIGRYLDQRMRGRASETAQNLLQLRAVAATQILPDGRRQTVEPRLLQPGDRVFVAAGMRLPADGRVVEGRSQVDTALITGETVPDDVAPGAQVFAGTLNAGAPLTVEVTARDEDSLLAEIVQLMESAEQGKARFVRLADKLVRLYAPGVHLLAAGTFAGWLIAGFGWHPALMAAIAVLIVTCPCALGLAVPVVQVVASGQLLKRGTLVKSGDALERLSQVDHVVFDKTGTLTGGALALIDDPALADTDLALAVSLARNSSHPLSRALAAARPELASVPLTDSAEHPGQGLSALRNGRTVRLGSRAWIAPDAPESQTAAGPELWLDRGDEAPIALRFTDPVRADAADTVTRLKRLGYRVELLSGDRPGAVAAAAQAAGIERWQAVAKPADKIARLDALAAEGRTVAMVGDGLNDAPALAAAHASLSPASASDVAQTSADIVFQGDRLAPVADTLRLARASQRHIKQNFGLALGYNCIAVPLAVAGLVTPLIAAICMSASSLLVTLNALRLSRHRG